MTATADLSKLSDGAAVRVSGLVLVRQRPETTSSICFITIEDETGIANLVVFRELFQKFRKEIIRSRLLMIEGRLQREGEVTHVVVARCFDLSGLLMELTTIKDEEPFTQPLSRADEREGEAPPSRNRKAIKPVQIEMFPGVKNFK